MPKNSIDVEASPKMPISSYSLVPWDPPGTIIPDHHGQGSLALRFSIRLASSIMLAKSCTKPGIPVLEAWVDISANVHQHLEGFGKWGYPSIVQDMIQR